ncbi:WD40 repeat-like protein [Hesseltinella vesiculosa]|uniref:WD40 repeat-like protein n=1 Tax=Hesseltinella vesiculosa TaxID=101127 RepID=A0A1X2G799_9FUNG|nr:WD40 repeat-like protein [Hesseltinella vesiculosa]
MSVYNHRSMVPPTSTRLVELLDTMKNEYDQLAQEVMAFKSQRDEFEHKVNGQNQEMTLFKQYLVELERSQHIIKKQYEEEISRLRQQLDQLNSGPPSSQPPSSASANIPNYGGAYGAPPPPSGLPPPPPMMDTKPPLHSSYDHHSPYMNGGSPLPTSTPPAPQQQQLTPGRPSTSKPTTPMQGLNDIDPESVPEDMKIEGQDWFALFNPKAPRYLKVDLVHTFDHSSVVCCVKFSFDGRYLAAGCNQATYIYDTQSSMKVAVLQDETAGRDGDLYIRSVSFSPDGKYLATGAEDKQIRIWDIAKNRIRNVLAGHEQDIYSLEFSRDGRILVSGSGDRTARIWDWEGGYCTHVLHIKDPDQKDPGVTSVAVSPDGRLVAAGSLDKVVRVWDAHTGKHLERLEGHKDSVYSVAFMPDGKTLVSGSLDKTLRLWTLGNPQGGKVASKQVFTGHKDFVLSVATTPDGKWIVSGSKDRGVQFWDPRTGLTEFMLQGHKNSVISVATSPGRKPLFATGSGDNRARIWSYEPIGP